MTKVVRGEAVEAVCNGARLGKCGWRLRVWDVGVAEWWFVARN